MGPGRFAGNVVFFVFSSVFYLSFFLAILAPFPIILAHLHRGRLFAVMASVINAALVFALSRWSGLAGYAVFTLATSWAVAELLRRRQTRSGSRNAAAAGSLFWLLIGSASLVLLVALSGVAVWSKLTNVAPWAELNKGLDWLGREMIAQAPHGTMDAADWAEQKEQILRNFPSTFMVAILLQCWVAMVLTLRVNPTRIRERLGIPASFQRLWKNPDFLVWPTIVAGFGAVVAGGLAADWCWNLLKVFLALYGLQGLAILSGIFDLWKLRGLVRLLAFFLVFALMLPLVLALGFFDLWFDFRAKFRQS